MNITEFSQFLSKSWRTINNMMFTWPTCQIMKITLVMINF